MCGIAGIVHSDLDPDSVQSAVRSMIALQRHRGPDGEGYYDGSGVSFGHARLSIIDLSENGKQPMADPTGRYWITYNGEIYNYLELASLLEKVGFCFRSRSDTEVLLYSYIHWGQDCVHHLRGMFAFAIWDQVDHHLFAARDRLGIKPLHYWSDLHGNLFFSSEIKAILPFVSERKIHTQLASEYIAWNMLDHDNSQTMFENIKRLPAGCTLNWKANQRVSINRYWELSVPDKASILSSSHSDLIHEFRERFEEVIKLHLRSDVPIGTSLSGGLDSSAIVGVLNKQLRKNGIWREGWQNSFSACFNELALDERPYINEIVSSTGIDPHYVFPSGDQLLEDFENWMWSQEEPVGGTNAYAQYCVARNANQHGIKVLIDGQGADEQLAGYRKFILVYLQELFNQYKYASAIHEGLAFFLSPDILRTSRFVDGRRYLSDMPFNSSILWNDDSFPKRPLSLELGNSLHCRLNKDITQSSLPILLRYEDRNSMAFGVEARVPFVDHEFMEWIGRLPSDMLLHNGWTKYILRESLADVLPSKIKNRKTKLGFLTPEKKWLSGPLRPWLIEMLRDPKYLDLIVNTIGVDQLMMKYEEGNSSAPLYNTLFRLGLFEFWARQFLGEKLKPIRVSYN